MPNPNQPADSRIETASLLEASYVIAKTGVEPRRIFESKIMSWSFLATPDVVEAVDEYARNEEAVAFANRFAIVAMRERTTMLSILGGKWKSRK